MRVCCYAKKRWGLTAAVFCLKGAPAGPPLKARFAGAMLHREYRINDEGGQREEQAFEVSIAEQRSCCVTLR